MLPFNLAGEDTSTEGAAAASALARVGAGEETSGVLGRGIWASAVVRRRVAGDDTLGVLGASATIVLARRDGTGDAHAGEDTARAAFTRGAGENTLGVPVDAAKTWARRDGTGELQAGEAVARALKRGAAETAVGGESTVPADCALARGGVAGGVDFACVDIDTGMAVGFTPALCARGFGEL